MTVELANAPVSATTVTSEAHPASFRDPCGYIFRDDEGTLLRQVNACYEPDYRHLMDSGLYETLTSAGMLIEHSEVAKDETVAEHEAEGRVIAPRELAFISYPYEWAFSALKDAALLTLDVQLKALEHGMTLKDASAYNVQFDGSKPVFIDTLSLERYVEDQPWVAYGQFCRHFLAPLVLMAKKDVSLGRLLALHLDGIPLDLASSLLPASSKFSLSTLIHIHWHAKSIRRHANTNGPSKATATPKLSLRQQQMLLEGLQRFVTSLNWTPAGTEWADYYENHSYSDDGLKAKEQVVATYIDRSNPKMVWDLGANNGFFSRVASRRGIHTIACDIDPACVEQNYRQTRNEKESCLQALWLDLTNPTPAIGWSSCERESLLDRGPADLAMGLALVHHLAIANNTPLDRIADLFAAAGKDVIIEWEPKSDPQVQRLLRGRKDIFDTYDQVHFEAAFARRFEILDQVEVGDDGRVVYHLRGHASRGS